MRDTAHGWRGERLPEWKRRALVIGLPLVAWAMLGAAAVALWVIAS